MELIVIVVMACLMPIFTIMGFIVGYDINADRKIIRKKAKKHEPTADEIMLDRIDKATV